MRPISPEFKWIFVDNLKISALRLERYMYRCVFVRSIQRFISYCERSDDRSTYTRSVRKSYRTGFAYKFTCTLVGPADRRPLPNRYRPFRSLSNFRVGFRFFPSKPVWFRCALVGPLAIRSGIFADVRRNRTPSRPRDTDGGRRG